MKFGAYVGDISFSKEHEREADYVAAYLLARAGYDPEAGKEVWIKLAKASGRMNTQLLDTHPAGPDRLAGWQKAVNEVRYSSDLMPNLADAEYEPRLQQARVFGDSETNIQVNTAALSPSTSSSTAALSPSTSSSDERCMTIYQTAEYQQACLSKESASALVSSVSTTSSGESKRILGRTDPEVCGFALGKGSKQETPRWEADSFFLKYVDEAKRRGFSAHSCAALFGWKSAQTKQVRSKVGDVENKLTKLKGLYDKGLITQGSYDEKRRAILKAL